MAELKHNERQNDKGDIEVLSFSDVSLPSPESKVATDCQKTAAYTPRARMRYTSVALPNLIKKRGYKNYHQVPRLQKIVINMGVGEGALDSKKLQTALEALAAISGQKPIATKARFSVAGFKLRAGMSIGAKVTLRGDRMYDFVDRLIIVALPRVRDFRGLNPKSFDGNGNYAFGIKEHLIFPEINYNKVIDVWGFDVIVCTSARTDGEALDLLEEFDFPFMGRRENQ